MTRTIILLISLFLTVSLGYTKPITTPAYLGSLDTLSKFSATQRKALLNEETSKIPLMKNGENKFLDLITDPRVIYSSYLGGNGYDCGNGIAVDSKDNIYIVGYTGSTDFPTTDSCYQKEKKSGHDAFIAKFSPNGEKLLWCTYYGGNGTDVATDCVIYKDDNLIIVGKTNSTDFPVTNDMEQTTNAGSIDIFLMKFDGNGQRICARYYGGTGNDIAEGIALKSNGNIVITGGTTSIDLPVKSNPYQDHNNGNADVFVAEFDKDFSLVYSTYFGGYQYEMAHSVAVDNRDNVAIAGETKFADIKPKQSIYTTTADAYQKDTTGKEDCIITVFDANWKLKYSTLYGGTEKDIFNSVAFDNEGNIYLTGMTKSWNYPISPNAYKSKWDTYDATIVKFNKTFRREFSTYYGGTGAELGSSIYITNDNDIWITGYTNSTNYPIINGGLDSLIKPADFGGTAIMLIKMNNKGNPLYSDYISPWLSFGYNLHTTKKNIFFTGETASYDYPCTQNAIINWNEDISQEPYSSYLLILQNLSLDSVFPTDSLQILIYPNPFNEIINVKNIDTSKIENIKIVDLLGRTVFYTNIFNSRDITINTQIFAYGFYCLIIQSENKLYYYKMIKI